MVFLNSRVKSCLSAAFCLSHLFNSLQVPHYTLSTTTAVQLGRLSQESNLLKCRLRSQVRNEQHACMAPAVLIPFMCSLHSFAVRPLQHLQSSRPLTRSSRIEPLR
jgi:hypothetical protein